MIVLFVYRMKLIRDNDVTEAYGGRDMTDFAFEDRKSGSASQASQSQRTWRVSRGTLLSSDATQAVGEGLVSPSVRAAISRGGSEKQLQRCSP